MAQNDDDRTSLVFMMLSGADIPKASAAASSACTD